MTDIVFSIGLLLRLSSVLFFLIISDLLVCRYYLRVSLTMPFIMQVLIANSLGLSVILLLEYLTGRTTSIFGCFALYGLKLIIYKKSFPLSLRSVIAIIISTSIGIILGVIPIMLFMRA